jgi:hypothetical protein
MLKVLRSWAFLISAGLLFFGMTPFGRAQPQVESHLSCLGKN